MKIVSFIMLGVSLLVTVVVANNGPIGLRRSFERKTEGSIVQVNERSIEGNAKQKSYQPRRGTSKREVLEESSTLKQARKFETVVFVPQLHHEDYLERAHGKSKKPWKYTERTTMRLRRSLNPNQYSYDHFNNSIYYRIHEVSNAIHLEPVVNQKSKKSSFDWVMHFLGRMMNTHRKDSIDSSKDLNPPKPRGPLIGPINFPGLGKNVYIRQLEPLQDESSHVVLHLVTRRPKIPSVTLRPGVNLPLDSTSQSSSSRILGSYNPESSLSNRVIVPPALQSSQPYSTSHFDLKHLHSLNSRVPEFEKVSKFSTLGFKDVGHNHQNQYQPTIRSFHKESIYMPNYVQSAVRYPSQPSHGPLHQQVRSVHQHKASAHVHGDQLRNMATVPLLPSHNQTLSLYSTLKNETNNITKQSADDGHLHKVRTVNHFPRSVGNASMNFLTNHSEFWNSPVLINYQQPIWPNRIAPLTWPVKDQYDNGIIRNIDQHVVGSDDEGYDSGGGLRVIPAPKLNVKSQSRLVDGKENVDDGNRSFFPDNHQSNIVNYESTWRTLKLEGSDPRNNLTVVDGIGKDNENATIGHFQKVVVVDPHFSWPPYKPKITKIVANEETIKPVFEIAEDREKRGISGQST